MVIIINLIIMAIFIASGIFVFCYFENKLGLILLGLAIVYICCIAPLFSEYEIYQGNEFDVEQIAEDYNANRKIKYIDEDSINIRGEKIIPHKNIVYQRLFKWEKYTLVEYKYRNEKPTRLDDYKWKQQE